MDTLLFIPTSGLQTFLIILLSLMIIITIVGNILVCLSVVLVRKLRSPSNYLLVSLAISDLGVAILVMPLALNLEVKGSWDLGHTLCDMWIAFDVTSCAASILNLCMISVDRYLTITRPLTYGVKRTTKRMFVFIGTVWITSILVSIPPLLVSGNEHGTDDEPQCQISQNIGYQLYATFASFYIPLAVMIILYYKIYNAAKSVVDAEMRSLGITQHRYVPPSYKPLLASRASTTVTTINNNNNNGNNNGSGGKKIVSSGESNVLTASHQILHPQHHSLQQPSPPLPSSQHPKNTANCKNHQNYHNQMSHHSQPPSHLHPHHHQHLHQHYQTSTTLGDQRVRNNNNTNTNNNNNNNNNEDNDNNSNQITGADIIKLDCNMASLNEPIGVKGWPMIETGYLKSSSGHHSLNHHHHHHHDNHQMVSPFTTGTTVGNPTSTHPHPRNGMICCADGIAHYPPHAHHYHRNRNLHRHHSSSSGSGVGGGGGGSRNGSGKGCPGRSRSSGLQTTLLASYKRVKESVLPSMRRNRRQRGHRSSNRKSSKIMCTIDSGNDDNPISNSGQCDCANMINSNDVAALASSFECDTSQSNQMTSTNRNGQPSTSSSFGLDSHSDQSSSMTAEKRRTSSMLKERKASITLGVIMTAFTACWLPFFILALLRPFNIEIPRTVSSFAYWLGLANSMLNPIIYVTFHHDFRKAFRYLLGFQCASMDGRLRARAYQSQYGASPRHISNDKKPIHLRQQSFEVDEHYQRTYQSDCDRLSAGILSDTGASGGGGDRNRLQIEQCDVNVNPGEHSSTVNSSPRLTSL